MTEELLTKALELFTLTQPYTRDQLNQRREQLLHTWTPRRFANLTNNPKKYMQAYKKAEEMTRQIESSYALLEAILARDEGRNPDVRRKT